MLVRNGQKADMDVGRVVQAMEAPLLGSGSIYTRLVVGDGISLTEFVMYNHVLLGIFYIRVKEPPKEHIFL
jgi:hypothetical protein